MLENKFRQHAIRMLSAAVLGLPALAPAIAQAQPAQQVLGATIGEWSAQWWKWAQSIDASKNPLLDTDGRYCAEGQQGPVWFLAGVWGAVGPTVARTCHVPAARSIFFPIYTSIWVNTVWDNPNNTKDQMRECVAGIPGGTLGCSPYIPDFSTLSPSATLRLESSVEPARPVVFDWPIARAQSPFFSLAKYPENNIWGSPAFGFENGPSVADGFWVMMPPLKPGTYVLKFSASTPGPVVLQDLTYRLVVGR